GCRSAEAPVAGTAGLAAARAAAPRGVPVAAALPGADQPPRAVVGCPYRYLFPDRHPEPRHPAPAVVVPVAVTAGQPVPGDAGGARRDRARGGTAARGQALVGVPAAVHLATGARPRPCRG